MKRKTNIFYNSGPDSTFLTFSNYTEAMTGNFISTNTKLFPSKFICLYIPSLDTGDDVVNSESKKQFITEYLMGGYENKLAFLRDALIEKKKKEGKITYTVESELSSLSYLLEFIYRWDENTSIEYIGEISEQDFNGTYTDSICAIDTSIYKNGELIMKESDGHRELYPYEGEGLYGWNVTFNSYIDDIKPIFDLDSGYLKDSIYKEIKLSNQSIEDIVISPLSEVISEIKFNVIIPLFDIVNIDYETNKDIVNEEYDKINLDYSNRTDNAPYVSDVPWGIWFAPDGAVTLKRDIKKKFAQTWSLVIGSQFKPFPYMTEMPSEVKRDAVSNAYMTFSEALTNQTDIINQLISIQNSLANFNTRLGDIENKLSTLGISGDNIDNLKIDFEGFKTTVNNQLNIFREELNSTELRWMNREG